MAKIPVGELHSLSIGDLTKGFPLKPGAMWRRQISWRNFSVGIRVEAGGVWLSYLCRENFTIVEKAKRVEFCWLRVGYGTRAYFTCPACNRRCAKIFLRFGRWACKQCSGACSDGCNATPEFRRLEKLEKLKRKLGARGGNPVNRPKGMHRKTFRRLYGEAAEVYRQCSLDGAAMLAKISKRVEGIRL